MHSVRIEPTKLILVGTRISYQPPGRRLPGMGAFYSDFGGGVAPGRFLSCVVVWNTPRSGSVGTSGLLGCDLELARKAGDSR